MWFLNRSDTSQPVQSQKTARSMKFWILEEKKRNCAIREAKTKALIDQLRGYRETDLLLCFRLVYADC